MIITINRIVVLLSPIFVGLAGWVAELAAKYLPGHPQLDQSELTAVFIAGATWAAVHTLLWLHGWQKHEAQLARLELAAAIASQPESESGFHGDWLKSN